MGIHRVSQKAAMLIARASAALARKMDRKLKG